MPVLNPIAEHLDVMRTTLLPGLITTLQANARRKLPRVRIFEVGRTFSHDVREQPLRIGGLAFGSEQPEQWGARERVVDFFDVKGDIEALASPLPIATSAHVWPWLHPGRAAEIRMGEEAVGWLGELHPRLVRHFELAGAPIVFELDLASLTRIPLPQAHAVSRLPSLRRDIAIIVNENIAVADILQALRDATIAAV